MKNVFVLIVALTVFQIPYAQKKQAYSPRIEACDCPVKIDSSFETQCGYLIVPENRKKARSNLVKLPFVWVKSKDPRKRKDPVLFTAGGPGGSSLNWATGTTRRTVISNRDCIAFEQRGTHFAVPNLWSTELSDAIKESYQKNLDKDSMVIVGTIRYKKSLESKGIDLSGYNTDETVSDIHDLLKTLGIDSVNLFGGSYSGGLMLAVLQKDPSRIRSLILDSPLPTFVPIDEEEPNNFNEALKVLSDYCKEDSSDQSRYGKLHQTFVDYFNSIENKIFSIPVKKGDTGMIDVQYTRSELLAVVVNAMFDQSHIKEVPWLITEIARGNHEPFVTGLLEHTINRNSGPSGMRISVYCADQTAYHDEKILQQFYSVYPYLRGYHINDVYREMCDCWKVPPIDPKTKQPFFSDKPVLLLAGYLDPACRPLYIDMIHHYMSNSQRLLFTKRSHMVLNGKEGDAIMKSFLDDPFKKIAIDMKDVVVY